MARKPQAPRVALTVPDDVKSEYDRISSLFGQPTSVLLLNIITEALPGMQKIAKAIEDSKSDGLIDHSKIIQSFDEIGTEARKQTHNAQLDLEDHIASIKKPK